MKKIICTFIASILLILSFPVMAADNCKISADNTEAMSGGTALVTLKIENNPGMAIGKVKLNFDKDKLIPVSVEKGDTLASAWSFTSNLDDPNIDSSELDYVTVSWMNMANITGDGTLAVIEFAVKDDVSGSTDIDVEVSELANDLQNNITSEAVAGKVTISNENEENPTSDDIVLGFSTTTVTKTDNMIGGGVSVSVYVDRPIEATFIYTIFDDKGVLLAVRTKTETLKAGINEVFLGELNAKADSDSDYYVKVYMWNSLDGMKPLTNAIIKKYQ